MNRSRTSRRHFIEVLEDRIAPATLLWDGSEGDGNWLNPLNWNGNAVPGPNDTAVLGINSSIMLLTSVTVGSFQQTSGTLDGPGSLVINGDLLWSGGTMKGSGITSIAGSSSLINGATSKVLDRTLSNDGTLNISTPDSGSNFAFGTVAGLPGHLVNTASGTVNVTAGGDFNASTDPNSSIDNGGSWNFSGPAATTSNVGATIVFNNTGSLNVLSGTFASNGGGIHSGSVTIAGGATLDFSGGTHDLNAGSTITGPGTLEVSLGTWNFNAGNYSVTSTRLIGGAANFTTAATTRSLTLSAGATLAGPGDLTVTGDLTWTGGTMTGTGSTILAGVPSTISGTNSKTLNRTLINSGTLSISTPDIGSNFAFGTAPGLPGHLVNTSSGTVNVTAGGDFNASTDPNSSIDNAGTWNSSGPAATTSNVGATIAFNNTGSLNVLSGTFASNGGGIHSGSVTISGGAILDFSGGTHDLNAGSIITGAGTVEVSLGTWNFNAGNYSVASTLLSGGRANFTAAATTTSLTLSPGGTLAGSGDVNVTGDLNWTGGTMTGTGSTILTGLASAISGTNSKVLNRTLINSGTLNISTPESGSNFAFGTVAGLPGHLVNTAAGTVNVTAGGDFNASTDPNSSIENAGVWNFSGPVATTSNVASTIAFNNTGTLKVSSGTFAQSGGGSNGGAIIVVSGATIDFSGDVYNLNGGSTVTGSGTVEVSFGTWNLSAGSYDVAATRISGGTANIETAATTSSLTVTGGTLGGGANFTVSGNLTWSGGTMTGTGSTAIAGGASTISPGGSKVLNRTLINSGTLSITTPDIGSTFVLGTVGLLPGHLVNTSGGTVNVSAGGDFAASTASSTIDNAGSWNVTGPAGTTSTVGTSIAFNNSGTVAVASGTLELSGGGANTGNFAVTTGAELEFSGGTYNMNAGSSASGAGTVVVSFGTWNLNAGNYNLGTTRISGGTANFDVAATTTALTLTGGILAGDALLSVPGDLNWSGGTMTGTGTTSISGSASSISSSATKTLNRILMNSGTLSIATADSSVSFAFGTNGLFPGHLVNTLNGIVDVTTGADFTTSTASSSIDNAGMWNFTGPAGTISNVGTSISFNNTATVNITSGTVEFDGGGTGTGTVTVASGATLEFGGGAYNLNAGAVINGSGTMDVTFGTWNFNAGSYNIGTTRISGGVANFEVAATTGSLSMSAGELGGGGDLSVTGNLSWSGGTMEGSGNTMVAGAASKITGGGSKILNRTLTNSGTLDVTTLDFSPTFAFGSVSGEPGHLVNTVAGVVNVTSGGDFDPGADTNSSIENAGNWNSSGPAGTTSTVGSTIAFKNTGTLTLVSGTLTFAGSFTQTSGSTRLAGGSVQTDSELVFDGGELSGPGTITGNLKNTGATVIPGFAAPGVLAVTGDYTQAATGTLQVSVGGTTPGTQHDQLAVGGTAALGGSLAVNLINGYTPSPSDVLHILVANTRAGTFASVTSGTLTASYTPSEVRLAVGTTPSISINDVSILEGTSGTEDLTFTVSLSGPSNQTVTVQFATLNGTAIAPEDYVARTQATLTFLPGEISKILDIAVKGDLVLEGDEIFFVELSNAVNATLGDAVGQGTILNDDGGLTLGINHASAVEGISGTSTALFTVTLSAPSDLPVSVEYATVDGTAMAGQDYTAIPLTTITFAPGETSQTISVAISGDTSVEPTEYFGVALSNPTNAVIGAGVGAGTIRNDDFNQPSPGKLSFPEPDGDLVTVTLKGATLIAGSVTLGDDGTIEQIDLTQLAVAQQASGGKPLSLKVGVSAGGGDGLTKVGRINASGLGMGTVSLQGDLGEIAAGTAPGKAALKSLNISRDFGLAGRADRISEILGSMGTFKVGGSVQKASINVQGKIKAVQITQDLVGELGSVTGALHAIGSLGFDQFLEGGNPLAKGMLLADEIGTLRIGGSVKGGAVVTGKSLGGFSLLGDFLGGGLFSDGAMKTVKVAGALRSDDPAVPVTITAKDRLGSMVIGKDITNATVLAGYNKSELPVSADAQIGKVLVKGNWTASSLVAGVQDITGDGFGRNDTVIAGDSTPSVLSKIAKVVIKGTVSGSAAAGDHFGITAQQIGHVSIGGVAVALSASAPDDILLDEVNGDFRILELA